MTAVSPALGSELLDLGSATLYEASGIDCDLDPAIRAAWSGANVCGPALPVRSGPADNLALHAALERAQPGAVLVVDAGGLRCGYWGEVLAVAAQQRGIAGLVIDGGVRDVAQLQTLGFPVFSRWVAVRRTAKAEPGTIGTPIECGDRTVALGDTIVADADGIVAIPSAVLERTLKDARARVEKEQAFLRRIRTGESTLDLYGWRELVASSRPAR